MGNVVVGMILTLIIAAAAYSTVKRIRYGSSCCGTKEVPDKRVKVRDKNKSHYPYRYDLQIDGMHCTNCARRIENAFHETDGRWAKADVEHKVVQLLSKREESESDLSSVIEKAGYRLVSCTQTHSV